jgi:hypothetical protein
VAISTTALERAMLLGRCARESSLGSGRISERRNYDHGVTGSP